MTEADEQFILQATREIVEDLGERLAAAGRPSKEVEAVAPRKVRLLGVRAVTRWTHWRWRCSGNCSTRPGGTWKSCRSTCCPPSWWPWPGRRTQRSSASGPCRRAAGPYPLPVQATAGPAARSQDRGGTLGLKANVEENEQQLREAGADQFETTLLETRIHLSTWLPRAHAPKGRNGQKDG